MEISINSLFEEKVKRLKHELNVKTDSAVAKFLGVSGGNFSYMRKNNNFPDKRLIEKVKNDKNYSHVDVEWVLTGKTRMEYILAMGGAPRNKVEFEEYLTSLAGKLVNLPRAQQDSIKTLINHYFALQELVVAETTKNKFRETVRFVTTADTKQELAAAETVENTFQYSNYFIAAAYSSDIDEKTLLQALQNENPEVRLAAVRSPKATKKVVMKAIDDKDWRVRYAAAGKLADDD